MDQQIHQELSWLLVETLKNSNKKLQHNLHYDTAKAKAPSNIYSHDYDNILIYAVLLQSQDTV